MLVRYPCTANLRTAVSNHERGRQTFTRYECSVARDKHSSKDTHRPKVGPMLLGTSTLLGISTDAVKTLFLRVVAGD